VTDEQTDRQTTTMTTAWSLQSTIG